MPAEPLIKRVFAFFDGQNLFYAAKEAFGTSYPNYDPVALAHRVCSLKGWPPPVIHFYTGVPSPADNPFWHHFWNAKLAVLGTRGVRVFSRSLKYRNKTVHLPGGTSTTVLVGQEKGIDVRISLDVVRGARDNHFDVALVFSQDQDLSEVASEI